MEASMLVERNGVWRMLAAEDASASAAMVPSFEKGKSLVAGWRVAIRRRRVGLVPNVNIILVEKSFKEKRNKE